MKKLLVFGLFLVGCGQGPQGIPGQVGNTGPAGPSGIDGTQIVPVQFCVNPIPQYPTTFPEFGLCINGQIWAVYSANDGFLTLIPNGNYVSNGINASCSFTVTGCVISNQSN